MSPSPARSYQRLDQLARQPAVIDRYPRLAERFGRIAERRRAGQQQLPHDLRHLGAGRGRARLGSG